MKSIVSIWTEWRTTVAVMFVSAWMGMSEVSPFSPTLSLAADDLAKSAATVEELDCWWLARLIDTA